MARNVEDIVDPPHEPEVSILVDSRPVAAEVLPGEAAEVGLPDQPVFRVAVGSPQDAGPRLLNDEVAALIHPRLLAVLLENLGSNAEKRPRCGPRFQRCRPRKGGNQDAPRLRLPPRIDNGEFPLADLFVIPDPRLGVDRLADRAEDAEALEAVLINPLIPLPHEGPDGGGGGIEQIDLVLVDDLPEAAGVGVGRHPLKEEARRAAGEGAVDDVAVARHPPDIGGTEEGVLLLVIKDPLEGEGRVE